MFFETIFNDVFAQILDAITNGIVGNILSLFGLGA